MSLASSTSEVTVPLATNRSCRTYSLPGSPVPTTIEPSLRRHSDRIWPWSRRAISLRSLGRLVDLEELPFHAGADEQPVAVLQQAQHQGALAEHLADRAVRGDAVDRVLARRRRRSARRRPCAVGSPRWSDEEDEPPLALRRRSLALTLSGLSPDDRRGRRSAAGQRRRAAAGRRSCPSRSGGARSATRCRRRPRRPSPAGCAPPPAAR